MENELFEKMPIQKAYMKLALPVVFSGVLTLVYNMVDMFFVAKTGDTNLVAGVTLCGPVFTLLIAMGDVFGLGGASVISRLFGMKKNEDGKRLSVFCLDGCFIFGILIAILLLVFKMPNLNTAWSKYRDICTCQQLLFLDCFRFSICNLSFSTNKSVAYRRACNCCHDWFCDGFRCEYDPGSSIYFWFTYGCWWCSNCNRYW